MPKSPKKLFSKIQTQIFFKFAYDGSSYSGVAYNGENCNTVEKKLFDALAITCLIPKDFDSNIKGLNFSRCGRTDAGVSATGNYISLAVFCDPNSIEKTIESKLDGVNRILPPNIKILKWSRVNFNFDARRDCVERIYKYSFHEQGMDIKSMELAAKKLEGTHDFRNFCKMAIMDCRNYVREIYQCRIINSTVDGVKEILIRGSGFLRMQVRYIATILFLIGKGLEDISIIDFLLDLKRCPSKPEYKAAPAKPLRLFDCLFKNSEQFKFKEISSKKIIQTKNAIEEKIYNKQHEIIFYKSLLEELNVIERSGIKRKDIEKTELFQEVVSRENVGSFYKFLFPSKKYTPIKNLRKERSFEQREKELSGIKKQKYLDKWKLDK